MFHSPRNGTAVTVGSDRKEIIAVIRKCALYECRERRNLSEERDASRDKLPFIAPSHYMVKQTLRSSAFEAEFLGSILDEKRYRYLEY